LHPSQLRAGSKGGGRDFNRVWEGFWFGRVSDASVASTPWQVGAQNIINRRTTCSKLNLRIEIAGEVETAAALRWLSSEHELLLTGVYRRGKGSIVV